MGTYLNSVSAFSLYKSETRRPYFVDKSLLLEKLFPLVREGNSHICITRPRRFGKTVMANMVGAFFNKGVDSSELFGSLKIAAVSGYAENINKHNVIYIDFSKLPRNCKSYDQYIGRIENRLLVDLMREFPEADISPDDAVWDALDNIFNECGSPKFIFVLDEWDSIFHKDFITEDDKKEYIEFLSNLLKGNAYVSLTYMTGILPISKYSSGSALNMFLEYTMVTEPMFSEDFGFTDEEVDDLFQRYLRNTPNPTVSREGLEYWYDGYYTKAREQSKNSENVKDSEKTKDSKEVKPLKVYNPRSVVAALNNNNLGNYWTSSGPYDEIFYYIEKNVADVRKDLALMVAGEEVPARVQEYAATSMELSTKDEIFSAMVVYGFLSCNNGKVSIPNKELMDKFDELMKKQPQLGYVNRLAKESDRMLEATLAGDTETMITILEYAHNTETPILSYNNEVELSAIVNLVYLGARDQYRIEREDKAGVGYVDFIFYPYDKTADCIILELKVDHTPEEAIQQIKDKQYALRFKGKLGEESRYTGRILAVGISYFKKAKKHQCKIEEL